MRSRAPRTGRPGRRAGAIDRLERRGRSGASWAGPAAGGGGWERGAWGRALLRCCGSECFPQRSSVPPLVSFRCCRCRFCSRSYSQQPMQWLLNNLMPPGRAVRNGFRIRSRLPVADPAPRAVSIVRPFSDCSFIQTGSPGLLSKMTPRAPRSTEPTSVGFLLHKDAGRFQTWARPRSFRRVPKHIKDAWAGNVVPKPPVTR